MCPVQIFRRRLQLNVYLHYRYVFFCFFLADLKTVFPVCLQYVNGLSLRTGLIAGNTGYATLTFKEKSIFFLSIIQFVMLFSIYNIKRIYRGLHEESLLCVLLKANNV